MLDSLKRRSLLSMLRRQTPEALRSRAQGSLASVLASAARRSGAYATLLAEAGVTVADLAGPEGEEGSGGRAAELLFRACTVKGKIKLP